jgi:imidazole glycerol-phosphate synthase subunit HisH
MLALIDYGAGNLTSVKKAFGAIGAAIFVPGSPQELSGADAVVVPGVGHFAATSSLGSDWRAAILDGVERGRPLLGICLGMQWLFDGSTEAPDSPGLGVLEGRCELLRSGAENRPPAVRNSQPGARLKVPHVGWNQLGFRSPSQLLDGLADGAAVYFTHSYAAPVTPAAVATTVHGMSFASVVERGHVMGVQFHPEKSGAAGLHMLRNFLSLTRRT